MSVILVKKFCLAIILLSNVYVYSQVSEDEVSNNRGQNIGINDNDHFMILNQFARPISKRVNEKEIKGSKYFEEDAKTAKIYDGDNMLHTSLIKYNAFSDEIEIFQGDKSFALLKKESIKVVLNDYHYEILKDKGYFVIFNKDKNTTLALKPKKKIRAGEEAASTYGQATPTSFINNYVYFIKTEKGNLEKIKLKKKDVVSVLKDQKSKLEEFASVNKLSFKNEADVVKIIDYYNTL